MENINFGIDLGTTNSGICKFEEGKVVVYKNPVGFSETLPSVVSFRKGRISVGAKAREQMRTASSDVFASFKRKMGTDYSYEIAETNERKSPVELSAMVLKELLSFIPDEKPQSVVITIPASFDTIQSNATKKAGQLAGFTEVVLLQEPIAACLAYANSQNLNTDEEKNWLVYDFGGGTFDVALVKINERELKVIDHEGNNFLGGVDLDYLIIEKLLVPKIQEMLNEEDLFKKISNKTAPQYAKLYYELLYKAEEIKKELSIKETIFTEIELNDGEDYIELNVTRNDFNRIIDTKIEESIQLIYKLLEDNPEYKNTIERIILVGGTTYIPYVREKLKETFKVNIDASIDPTTAIMVGAAYYAGSKPKEITIQGIQNHQNPITKNEDIDVKLIYEANTQDAEELLMGIVNHDSDSFYRIIRKDGGFDTGLIAFTTKFSEFLKVLPKQRNYFNVMVYNEHQNLVFENQDLVINHGIYNISGQPLPNDICLEVDDTFGNTYLERIFKKNEILPLSKTVYKTSSKNFIKESDDKMIINITEGKSGTLPGSNMTIGYIEINSRDLPFNLLKGMDIELRFSMTESRDLSVSVYISSIDFEINEIFNPHSKHISKSKFHNDINTVINEIDQELFFAENDEDNYTYYGQLKKVKDDLIAIGFELIDVEESESTERIFQLDERKRRTLQAYDDLVRLRNVIEEIEEYRNIKHEVELLLDDASPRQKEQFKKIIKDEKSILESNEKSIIKGKAKELDMLHTDLYYKKDDSYVGLYYHYKFLNENDYSDHRKLNQLIEAGDRALENENYKEIKHIVHAMYNLLKVKPKSAFEDQDGSLGIK